jgi:hypothetical protein
MGAVLAHVRRPHGSRFPKHRSLTVAAPFEEYVGHGAATVRERCLEADRFPPACQWSVGVRLRPGPLSRLPPQTIRQAALNLLKL